MRASGPSSPADVSATPGPARRPRGRPAAGSRFRGLAAAVGIALIGLTGCGGGEQEGKVINLSFPPGTSERIERGQFVDGIPEQITARVGDTLVIRNRDRSTQFIAGYAVSPDQTLRIPLNRAGDYITNCSAHKDKSIRMVVSD